MTTITHVIARGALLYWLIRRIFFLWWENVVALAFISFHEGELEVYLFESTSFPLCVNWAKCFSFWQVRSGGKKYSAYECFFFSDRREMGRGGGDYRLLLVVLSSNWRCSIMARKGLNINSILSNFELVFFYTKRKCGSVISFWEQIAHFIHQILPQPFGNTPEYVYKLMLKTGISS